MSSGESLEDAGNAIEVLMWCDCKGNNLLWQKSCTKQWNVPCIHRKHSYLIKLENRYIEPLLAAL